MLDHPWTLGEQLAEVTSRERHVTCITIASLGDGATPMDVGGNTERRLRDRMRAVSPEVMQRIARQRRALAASIDDLASDPNAPPGLAGRLTRLRQALRDHAALVDAVFEVLQDDGEAIAESDDSA